MPDGDRGELRFADQGRVEARRGLASGVLAELWPQHVMPPSCSAHRCDSSPDWLNMHRVGVTRDSRGAQFMDW